MTEIRDVGFIGLGEQGAPIVTRIMRAGFRTHLWARRREALAPFEADGAKAAATPKDLGAACDFVGVCVMGDADVEQVLVRGGEGVLCGMRAGGIVAIHSTVMPETARELTRLAAERGIHVLDAPVSGRAAGALAGTMTVMAGGDEAVLERARPVLETFANNIALLGPVGAGQACKLLCNNVCFANTSVGLAALDLADVLGLDRDKLAHMIATSSASSTGFKVALERLAEYGRMRPGSAMGKDQRHFTELLHQCGVNDHIVTRLSADTVVRMRADDP